MMAGNQHHTGSPHGGSSDRGFGSMDEGKQRDIASQGGHSVPAEERSFSKDRELASEAGKKGGQARGSSTDSSASDRKDEDTSEGSSRRGNFAQDRERASEAGRKGGQR